VEEVVEDVIGSINCIGISTQKLRGCLRTAIRTGLFFALTDCIIYAA
jgi:hypothetical protein